MPKKRPTVFIVNRAAHDYSGAADYGDLVYCTDGVVDKNDIQMMYRELSDKMKDSRKDDFILLTSLTSLCCVACSIFVAKHKTLNLLIHRGSGSYLARSLTFP